MERSTNRILTTHTGSLPRPEDLVPLLYQRANGEPVDEGAFEQRVRDAVAEAVQRQTIAGIDIVNDGEAGKVSYFSYVSERLTGFGGEGRGIMGADLRAFPEYAERMARGRPSLGAKRLACIGPIEYCGDAAVAEDIRNLREGLEAHLVADRFLTAASPGIISVFMPNQHYPSHQEYIWALAEAMKVEYDAIHRAGVVLQIDCPDLALGKNTVYSDLSIPEFLDIAKLHVEALNHATRDIPADAMRMHLCWGNYEGPHHLDIPFNDILDIVLSARPAGISFEGANPRHEHEWAIWQSRRLPAGKVLIPGVLDSTCNFVEHPELVAQRIMRYALLVGPENVIAGSDCGFATGAGMGHVEPGIAWKKLEALADGAKSASRRLFE